MIGSVQWKVDRLRAGWQTRTRMVTALNAAMDRVGFSENFVSSVNYSVGKKKHLKDSVWGMIEFDHVEIQLIDSPLLQRLRCIKQLGFSFLVYPSAEHSRFVHSLGMAHVVSSFANTIERNSDRAVIDSAQVKRYCGISSLLPLTRNELIFAALLHDIGHMPFSHASEAAVAQKDTIFKCGGEPLGNVVTEARHAFEKDISLSETLSILIVLSARFADYYRRLTTMDTTHVNDSLARIASLIAGVPATASCPNIQDLISAAAVDADKIDYVARDAASCGIAVGVDVSRIFMGSGLVEARRDAYDPSYEGEISCIVFVVNASGADTLDEIVQARSALYQRVYLHPVTRTAEALLSRALHRNAESGAGAQANLIDVLGLWSIDDAHLLRSLSKHQDPTIAALAYRLKGRVFPKKACALAGSVATIQTPLRNIFRRFDPTRASAIKKDLANSFIEKLTRKGIREIGAGQIESQIKAEALRLADALIEGGKSDLVPTSPLELVIVTPIAAMDASRPDALVFQAGELISTPALTNVQGQHDAQDIFKAVGYVFSDPDWRVLVLIATRTVILRLSEETAKEEVRHHIVAGRKIEVAAKRRTILDFEGVSRRANVPKSKSERVMYGAADVGYFDSRPELFLPTKPELPAVHAIAKTFRSFSGELGWSVDKITVAAFVDQLPPDLRVPMLGMLAQSVILDQAVLEGFLINAISASRNNDEAQHTVVCPLSASSGGEVVTIIRKLALKNVDARVSLREALNIDGRPLILLVDDNASSGVQASAQLYAHAGIAIKDRPTRFSREEGLFEGEITSDHLAGFLDSRLGIAVAIGLEEADRLTKETAKAIGFRDFCGLKFGAPIAEGLEWPQKLREFLTDVGQELLAYRYQRCPLIEVADPTVAERCRERAFGYAGRGGILATHGNVPSSTVTALWQPGIYRGRPWVPLLMRRGLLKDMVIG